MNYTAHNMNNSLIWHSFVITVAEKSVCFHYHNREVLTRVGKFVLANIQILIYFKLIQRRQLLQLFHG